MAGAEGGAAFLIPYIIFSFTLAFGLLLAEITLGKAGKGGIVTAYRNLGGPVWSVLGYLGVLIGFVVLSFYSVVGGWCLMYLFESIVGFSASTPQALGSALRRALLIALNRRLRSGRLPGSCRVCSRLWHSQRH